MIDVFTVSIELLLIKKTTTTATMTATVTKILFLCLVAIPLIAAQANDGSNNLLDVETPAFFNYNSPLRQPESLRSRPYFDFLSTLYRRDATKSSLFRPYQRARREAADEDSVPEVEALVAPLPAPVVVDPITQTITSLEDGRPKRAIVFRPLFVYKQQMIRKEELKKKRRKRV